jgi:hypothetical protein
MADMRAKAHRPEEDGGERPASVYGEGLKYARKRRFGGRPKVFFR